MPLRLLRHPLNGVFSAADAFRALHRVDTDVFWLDSGEAGTSYLGSGERWLPTAPVLDALRAELAGAAPEADDDAPPFRLGLVGWLGYELRGETMGVPVGRTSRYPDAAFLRVDHAVAIAADGAAQLLALGDAWEGELAEWRDATIRSLRSREEATRNDDQGGLDTPASPALVLRWHETDAEYLANIAVCQEAIREGEAYQLCLTTEASIEGPFDPVEVYARLRAQSPSHHGALLRIGGVSLLSSSPERFLEVDPGPHAIVRTHPIKGTRPRALDAASDTRLREELLASEKERAENIMIVDLMRNDLARVSEPGSVTVPSLLDVESYPQVHQLVSSIEGRLRPGLDGIDAIAACLPAGSMTGAPKQRATEILDKLEQRPRGLYAGAFGYLGRDGRVDLAMTIRSIVIDERGATIGTGGGITALSVPADEIAEARLKAAALLTALGLDTLEPVAATPELSSPRHPSALCTEMTTLSQHDSTSPTGAVHDDDDTLVDDPNAYDFARIQDKWMARWEEMRPYATDDPNDTRPRKYILDMFPYPSGDLHMGHAEAFAYGDIVARYWRLQGFNVLHPIGWDSFGLPAENAAIKRGIDPRGWTYDNIAQQKASFKRYGNSFDWSRELHTSDPEYYKWNQWLFLKLYEKGLAYRKDSWVNWDPVDQTVLANEQVLPDGTSERSGAIVVKKKLTQWYFKITDYADRLLDDLNQLEGSWPSKVLAMQRNWIGRSTGAEVDFVVEGHPDVVTVFTTRPDTLFGTTFMVVAPDSDLAAALVADSSPEVQTAFAEYLKQVQKSTEVERQDAGRDKTGISLDRWAINPINGERIPVWTADYVLADYGHGAVMGVPAHDQRDLDFALKFGFDVRVVVDTNAPATGALPVITPEMIEAGEVPPLDPVATGKALGGEGRMINSGPLDGLSKQNAITRVIDLLEADGTGRAAKTFRLRDWLISRQRYWGTPIPIIHGEDGALHTVPEADLPVRLPDPEGLDLKPKGASPLGAATDWVNVTLPDGTAARRDPDTMDTFVDSSWYFLRYLNPNDDTMAFDPAEAEKWAPIDQYVGGVEHAILHLLYARFITKVLFDMGYLTFTEPFSAVLNQGSVLLDGKAMSKSRGNLVEFASELDTHGADSLRLTMAFAGPPEDNIDWADVSPAGSSKFLARAWRISGEVTSKPEVEWKGGDLTLRRQTHHLLADAPGLMEAFKFNVVVARLMELVNTIRKTIDTGPGAGDPSVREAIEAVTVLLSMFAPHTAEDMWERLGYEGSVSAAPLRKPDATLLVEESVTSIFQVDGKVRDKAEVSPTIGAAELETLARESAGVIRAVGDREIANVIVRAPRVVNIATVDSTTKG